MAELPDAEGAEHCLHGRGELVKAGAVAGELQGHGRHAGRSQLPDKAVILVLAVQVRADHANPTLGRVVGHVASNAAVRADHYGAIFEVSTSVPAATMGHRTQFITGCRDPVGRYGRWVTVVSRSRTQQHERDRAAARRRPFCEQP